MKQVPVSELLSEENLRLTLLNSEADLSLKISDKDINRPGLALAGFYDYFASDRIQIFGNGEWAYLQSLSAEEHEERFEKFFMHPLTCLVFTHDHQPPNALLEFAKTRSIPLLTTPLNTHQFIIAVSEILDRKLAPNTTMHGVMVEVFGVGILITGASGVGKSETALELLERGHRLVADDYVEVTVRGETRLYGRAHPDFEHHMEIRGLGIVNIKDLFGFGSVRLSKRLDLLVELETWDKSKEYDRLGLHEKTRDILGVPVSLKLIPVKPGRNIPILIETAAKNYRLQSLGIHPARKFAAHLEAMLKKETEDNYGNK